MVERLFVVFCVSSCSNSVNEVGHVGKTFDHKDLGNRLLRLCPELMSRPIIMEKNRDYMRNYFYSAKRWKWLSKEKHYVHFQEIRTWIKNHCADDTALNTGRSVIGALREVRQQSCKRTNEWTAPDAGFRLRCISGHPPGADWTKILALNRKDWLSVAVWRGLRLQGLQSASNDTTEREKNMCNIFGPWVHYRIAGPQ